MTRRILLYKCWNCGSWGDFSHDAECECGVMVYEDSDPFNQGQHVETLVIDTDKAVRILERLAGGKLPLRKLEGEKQ